MLFLGLVMMPFYYISKTHSVPGYLKLRFGEASRALSAICFAFMTVLMSGINMYAMALVMKVVLGWDINFSIWISSLTVAVYVTLGGLRSAIFNEVLQFILIWAGALVIPVMGLIEAGGWKALQAQSRAERFRRIHASVVHARLIQRQPDGHSLDRNRLRPGLRDFIRVLDDRLPRRAARAGRERSARREDGPDHRRGVQNVRALHRDSPRLLGLAVLPMKLTGEAAAVATGGHSYNEVLPLMLARYCGPGLLGLGITALIAGFMSGMAGNVSAFSTVWTYDIYKALIKKKATDAHYVLMGRWSTILGVLISIGTAYLVMQFLSIMDYVQALFSFFVAPLFGTVILGMLWKRATAAGGFWGLLAGTVSSVGMWAWVKFDPTALRYVALSRNAKDMAENMYRALWSWIICVVVTVVVSMVTKPKPESELVGLVYGATEIPSEAEVPLFQKPAFWAVVVTIGFIALNIIFW